MCIGGDESEKEEEGGQQGEEKECLGFITRRRCGGGRQVARAC